MDAYSAAHLKSSDRKLIWGDEFDPKSRLLRLIGYILWTYFLRSSHKLRIWNTLTVFQQALIILFLPKWTCKLIPLKLHQQLEQPKTTIIAPLHWHWQRVRLLYFLLG